MSLLDGSLVMNLLQNAAPLLPQSGALPWLRQIGWALVLAALLGAGARLCDGRRLRETLRFLAGTLALWALIPGPWGLSYWLGLAFQTPSLMAMALSLRFLWPPRWAGPWPHAWQSCGFASPGQLGHSCYVLLGMVLGWSLLFDTFAFLPVSLYAWGFHPLAASLLALVALLPWVINGRLSAWGGVPTNLLLVLAVFGLARWPTGNVWDAVLDPWLFVGLNFYAFRCYRARRGG